MKDAGLDEREIDGRLADLRVIQFLDGPAGRLRNGRILVSPDLAFHPKEYAEALDNVPGTLEEKLEAKRQRVAMRDAQADDFQRVLKKSSAYLDFLDRFARQQGFKYAADLEKLMSAGELVEEFYRQTHRGVGNLGELIKQNFSSTTNRMGQEIWQGVSSLSQTPSSPIYDPTGTVKRLAKSVADIAREDAEESERTAATVGGGFWAKRIAAIINAAHGTAPALASAGVGAGFVGSAAITGFLQSMGIYNDALAAGKNPKEAGLLALQSGARETAITIAFGKTGLERIHGPVVRGSVSREVAKGAALESIEELVQLWAQISIRQEIDPNYQPNWETYLDTILGASFVGGTMHALRTKSISEPRKLSLDGGLMTERGNDGYKPRDWSARLPQNERFTGQAAEFAPSERETKSETKPTPEARDSTSVLGQKPPLVEAIRRLKPIEQMVLIGGMVGKTVASMSRVLGLPVKNTAIAFQVAIEKTRRWLKSTYGFVAKPSDVKIAPEGMAPENALATENQAIVERIPFESSEGLDSSVATPEIGRTPDATHPEVTSKSNGLTEKQTVQPTFADQGRPTAPTNDSSTQRLDTPVGQPEQTGRNPDSDGRQRQSRLPGIETPETLQPPPASQEPRKQRKPRPQTKPFPHTDIDLPSLDLPKYAVLSPTEQEFVQSHPAFATLPKIEQDAWLGIRRGRDRPTLAKELSLNGGRLGDAYSKANRILIDAGALDTTGAPTTDHLTVERFTQIVSQLKGWKDFNYGEFLARRLGPQPPDMLFAHAHHILEKEGGTEADKALVREGQAILLRYKIDPYFGLEVLTWAPQYAKGQHTAATIKMTVDALKKVEAQGGARSDIVDALKYFGKLAAKRK